MKKTSIQYLLVVVLLMVFGLVEFERGFFWVTEQTAVLGDSDFYKALHRLMPIWIWGALAMIFSSFTIASPFFLPKQQHNNMFNYLIFIGGCGNAIFYFLMTCASIYHAINWLSPLHFVTFTMLNGIVAFLGGVEIAKRK